MKQELKDLFKQNTNSYLIHNTYYLFVHLGTSNELQFTCLKRTKIFIKRKEVLLKTYQLRF